MSYMMMGTESPEKKAKRTAHNAWLATLPAEYDGLFLSEIESGYVDKYGNMTVHLTYADTGKDLATIFAENESFCGDE